MNINLSSILSNGMRILSIANKAIPLIKEANPTIKRIRDTIKKTNFNQPPNRIINMPFQEKQNTKKIVYQDNSLTFFR